MTTDRERWLALTVEKPIDPELPICDPHHHLWDRPGDRYLLADLLRDIDSGHNIVKTMFVECKSMYREEGPEEMRPLGETEFVRRVTAQPVRGRHGMMTIAAGIVGFADLTLGAAVKPVLEAQIAAGRGRLHGIRQMSAWDPGIKSITDRPRLLMDTRFREGFACLREYDLTFDAWAYHPQLLELLDLAKAFPDQPIILDHVGGPIGTGPFTGKRAQVFEEWKAAIALLAACPNVLVKLGGLGIPLCGFGWHERKVPPGSAELAEAMSPYYLWCIRHFGVSRCMFESNFPVDRPSYPYGVMWNAFKRITRDLSPADRASLFHNNAVRVYRLDRST